MVYAKDLTHSLIIQSYYNSYQHEKNQEYKKAIHDLKPVYLSYPNTYTVNLRIGWLYYLNSNNSNAIERLTKALSLSPSSIEPLAILVLVYFKKSNWTKVEELCAKIQKIDYYNINANYWYSYALKMQRKYGLAITVNRKMLAVYPLSILFLQELGENLFLNGEKEKSMSVLSNLQILSPENSVVKRYLNEKK